MTIHIYLKINPNNPITVENLESFIVGNNATSISDTMKSLPITINPSQTYLFIGKKQSAIILGSEILYLTTTEE